MSEIVQTRTPDTDPGHARLPDGQGHGFEPEILAFCCEH